MARSNTDVNPVLRILRHGDRKSLSPSLLLSLLCLYPELLYELLLTYHIPLFSLLFTPYHSLHSNHPLPFTLHPFPHTHLYTNPQADAHFDPTASTCAITTTEKLRDNVIVTLVTDFVLCVIMLGGVVRQKNDGGLWRMIYRHVSSSLLIFLFCGGGGGSEFEFEFGG